MRDVDIERSARDDAPLRERVPLADDDGVRPRIRLEHVERTRSGNTDSLALAGRERPVARVRSELDAGAGDDRTGAGLEAVPRGEAAVVASGEDAGPRTLRATGGGQPGAPRLVARRLLVLL